MTRFSGIARPLQRLSGSAIRTAQPLRSAPEISHPPYARQASSGAFVPTRASPLLLSSALAASAVLLAYTYASANVAHAEEDHLTKDLFERENQKGKDEPLKQDLLPGRKERAPKVYATQETVDKVVGILKGKLEEGQVTVNEDELLSHGHSPNTYHS
jgi:hypothetical protein